MAKDQTVPRYSPRTRARAPGPGAGAAATPPNRATDREIRHARAAPPGGCAWRRRTGPGPSAPLPGDRGRWPDPRRYPAQPRRAVIIAALERRVECGSGEAAGRPTLQGLLHPEQVK